MWGVRSTGLAFASSSAVDSAVEDQHMLLSTHGSCICSRLMVFFLNVPGRRGEVVRGSLRACPPLLASVH